MKDIQGLNLEVERVKGDIRLIRQSIEIIETNHLTHIEKDIASIRKVMWTVGIMVFGQFIIVIKDILLP
jgi:predicted neutral ceramidase superfamily lipid hydrolase